MERERADNEENENGGNIENKKNVDHLIKVYFY